jgi:hypothetical protein
MVMRRRRTYERADPDPGYKVPASEEEGENIPPD